MVDCYDVYMRHTPTVIMKAPQGADTRGAPKRVMLLAMGWTCVQAKKSGWRMDIKLVQQYAVCMMQRILARTRRVQGDGSRAWKKFLKEGQQLREKVLAAHVDCTLLLPVPPLDGGCEIEWNSLGE